MFMTYAEDNVTDSTDQKLSAAHEQPTYVVYSSDLAY